MKIHFTILLLFISIATIHAQDKRGTILVEKVKKKSIAPCICGKTDTLFISRKELSDNKKLRLELCDGKKNILKGKVLSYTSLVTNYTIQIFFCSGNTIFNCLGSGIQFLPKSFAVIIKDVKYNTDSGVATLPGNLVVALTD